MKLAVMQPYLFPYIGYYQLAHAADLFIIYDDVQYIKRGYINRNYVLCNGEPKRFTLPVPGASQNVRICDLSFSADVKKIEGLIKHAYSKAPYFNEVFPLVCEVLRYRDRSIGPLCRYSIELIFDYLQLPVSLKLASSVDYDRDLPAADRLLELCKVHKAHEYINSAGGRSLYAPDYFESKGINIRFLDSEPIPYPQGCSHFVANLSFVDTLMWCSKAEVTKRLNSYRVG